MRNLKKLLALVLALVMSLSLVTIASAKSASDFADGEDITYTEAVDVMTAVGVFEGVGNNTFEPDTVVTREQAAKIVTYMLMGKDKADRLTTTVAPYADVAADRWSAGAIAYCTNEGILAGTGGGKFDPAGKLTGLQFAKIMLTALGYDAKQEKLTGSAWAINTAKLAITAGLDDELEDLSLSAAMTREQAAQMSFNTMKADLVDYDTNTSVTVGDVTFSVSGKAKAVTTAVKADGTSIVEEAASPYTVQFAEQYQSDLVKEVTTTDDLGRPGHGWTYDKDEVGSYADDAKLVYTAKVEKDDLTKDLKGYKVAAKSGGSNGKVTIVTNAATHTSNDSTITNAAESAAALTDGQITSIVGLTGNGKTVEIYADSKDIISTIVVIAPTFGEVTGVTATSANKTHGAYDTYTVDTSVASGKLFSTVVDEDKDVDTVVLNGEIAKDDKVTYYKGDKKLYIDPVTTLSGVLSAKTDKGVLTIDGTTYEVSAVTKAEAPGVSKKSQDFYVDSLGYIIKSYTDDVTNYAFVVPDSVKDVQFLQDDNSLKAVPRATLIFPDGTVETVTTSVKWTNTEVEGKVITYTINTKDEYVKGEADAGRTAAFTALPKESKTIGALKTNNKTVYYVANYDEDSEGKKTFNDTVTVYTGYTDVPTYASIGANKAMALDNNKDADGIADVVFIADSGLTATESGKYVYVKGSYTQTEKGYVYDTIVKGEDDTITKDGNDILVADTLYEDISTASKGAETGKAKSSGRKVENKGGLLYVDDLYVNLTVADDVPVYSINISDDSVSVGTAASLSSAVNADPEGQGGTRGVYVEKDSGDTKATAIYILYNSEDNAEMKSKSTAVVATVDKVTSNGTDKLTAINISSIVADASGNTLTINAEAVAGTKVKQGDTIEITFKAADNGKIGQSATPSDNNGVKVTFTKGGTGDTDWTASPTELHVQAEDSAVDEATYSTITLNLTGVTKESD